MKKKCIEAIEYLKLPKTSRKKGVKYIGVTACVDVAGEEHLFLEVYRNDKTAKDIPLVRVVVNQKDFGTYFPGDGSWTRKKIVSNEWHGRLIWTGPDDGYLYDDEIIQNILHDSKDLDRIKGYLNIQGKGWNDENWWRYIEHRQSDIVSKENDARRESKYNRRQQALEERKLNTPALREKEILEYADRELFRERHYLYYKKKSRRATVCCSECGGVASGTFKPGISYESQFEKHINEPRERETGHCTLCGALGIYKPQGKAKISHNEKSQLFYIDRYKETGAVIRYVEVYKEWQLEKAENDEMHGAYEIISGCEVARTYIQKEKKVQTDYCKHNPYTGKDFWDDCNLSGLKNIIISPAKVHPESWENIKGTCLQYSQAKEFFDEGMMWMDVKLNDYMENYMMTPQMEILVKMKLYGVVENMAKYRYGIIANMDAKNPAAFLGIHKDKVKLLCDVQGDLNTLIILQMENRMQENWTEEQVKKLAEIHAEYENVELALKYTTIQKLLNTIEKYAGCEFGTECTTAVKRLIHTATTYFDYLRMRQQRGYNLQNTIYLKPKDLEAAHAVMVQEINKEEQDKKIKEAEEKYSFIRKNYRKLRKQYLYEDDNYIIRPARSAGEIITEGRILHHCVGGNSYLQKHNEQKSIILMLRFKAEPEIPYITVEIKEENIIQWYGQGDKKPDRERMQKWLDAYVKELKYRKMGIKEEPGKEAERQKLRVTA